MNKACPIVLRHTRAGFEILAFLHPLAGKQLVKGTIEGKEMLSAACVRELREESGLAATAGDFLGQWDAGFESQVWGLYLMAYEEVLPDSWRHYTADDGGHKFSFFWHPLATDPDIGWHPVFIRALSYIKSTLSKSRMLREMKAVGETTKRSPKQNASNK